MIPSPAKPGVVWDQRQRNEAVKTLYLRMAKELDIPALETERSHVIDRAAGGKKDEQSTEDASPPAIPDEPI
ncbi:hypothetical protein GCM10010522_30250 [Kribbella solani]